MFVNCSCFVYFNDKLTYRDFDYQQNANSSQLQDNATIDVCCCLLFESKTYIKLWLDKYILCTLKLTLVDIE